MQAILLRNNNKVYYAPLSSNSNSLSLLSAVSAALLVALEARQYVCLRLSLPLWQKQRPFKYFNQNNRY